MLRRQTWVALPTLDQATVAHCSRSSFHSRPRMLLLAAPPHNRKAKAVEELQRQGNHKYHKLMRRQVVSGLSLCPQSTGIVCTSTICVC